MTDLTAYLTASQLIANRHIPQPPVHPYPRTKADISVLAEYDRAVCAWETVRVIEARMAIEEGRRT